MNEEAGFLSAIRRTPADDTARLVYADWLNEQDAPECQTKAEFIRLELKVLEPPAPNPPTLLPLRSLAATIPNDWLAVVSRPRLDASPGCARFVCPGRWDKLAPTAFDDLRRCLRCKRVARFCATLDEARLWWSRGERSVVVSPAVERRSGDLPPPRPTAVRLTPEMIERLRAASVRGAGPATLAEIWPPAPPVQTAPTVQWLPAGPPPNPRPAPRRPRNKRRRLRWIERENWEELE